jgi:hypothetical protein
MKYNGTSTTEIIKCRENTLMRTEYYLIYRTMGKRKFKADHLKHPQLAKGEYGNPSWNQCVLARHTPLEMG